MVRATYRRIYQSAYVVRAVRNIFLSTVLYQSAYLVRAVRNIFLSTVLLQGRIFPQGQLVQISTPSIHPEQLSKSTDDFILNLAVIHFCFSLRIGNFMVSLG